MRKTYKRIRIFRNKFGTSSVYNICCKQFAFACKGYYFTFLCQYQMVNFISEAILYNVHYFAVDFFSQQRISAWCLKKRDIFVSKKQELFRQNWKNKHTDAVQPQHCHLSSVKLLFLTSSRWSLYIYICSRSSSVTLWSSVVVNL